jgi:hypothetical protein
VPFGEVFDALQMSVKYRAIHEAASKDIRKMIMLLG